jgi:hypothetical protein
MLYIYSGKVRACQVGLSTPFIDAYEKPISTGDIVAVYHEGHDGHWEIGSDHFVVALAFHFDCYQGQEPIEKAEKETPFIMGYAGCQPRKEPENTETALISDTSKLVWHLVKVKGYEDVIHGEHWKEFGFNYQDDALLAQRAKKGDE